ncbi:hypothetical protein [Parerythrobacter lacustris]|uniref:Uncharacterized protein n=1 Tax=Parerythrobacter lacustris TaxID=2969984 RepID=A0ABT1XU73_9SPHN|nr:hypothetical protein [Parerythrobacter lacustris]MCR2835193.1 hypothetical protein [Parerythrobacter lacustris]
MSLRDFRGATLSFNQIKDAANTVLADYNYNPRGELAQIDRAATAPDKV